VARETREDWRLLAAIGYQESKWDPTAVSPTGVKGLMMLTAETAQRLGVKDREDPRQSIFGGARYLQKMRETIPERVPEPDRTWLALAAYNLGYGHLEDGRILTQMHGKDPDSWQDVREHLPLLGQERWYMQVKRGYARGWEAVKFVDNVRGYLDILEWVSPDPQASGAIATAAN
jgi:membrane-bound lytic murein transglycosylase F